MNFQTRNFDQSEALTNQKGLYENLPEHLIGAIDGGKVKNFLPSARRRRKQCSRTTWTSLFIPIDGSITWGINDSWTVSISSYWNSRASLGTRRISPSGKTTGNRDTNHQIDNQYIDIRPISILWHILRDKKRAPETPSDLKTELCLCIEFLNRNFKGSPYSSHFIYEIIVGKSRIRHRTTLDFQR